MKYFTQTISLTLAEKLKEKGMPLGSYVYTPNGMVARKDEANLAYYDDQLVPYCVYGFVFDWFMSEKEIEISFVHHFRATTIAGTMETSHEYYHANISMLNGGLICYEMGNTWHEAANAAIEKAITLI